MEITVVLTVMARILKTDFLNGRLTLVVKTKGKESRTNDGTIYDGDGDGSFRRKIDFQSTPC